MRLQNNFFIFLRASQFTFIEVETLDKLSLVMKASSFIYLFFLSCLLTASMDFTQDTTTGNLISYMPGGQQQGRPDWDNEELTEAFYKVMSEIKEKARASKAAFPLKMYFYAHHWVNRIVREEHSIINAPAGLEIQRVLPEDIGAANQEVVIADNHEVVRVLPGNFADNHQNESAQLAKVVPNIHVLEPVLPRDVVNDSHQHYSALFEEISANDYEASRILCEEVLASIIEYSMDESKRKISQIGFAFTNLAKNVHLRSNHQESLQLSKKDEESGMEEKFSSPEMSEVNIGRENILIRPRKNPGNALSRISNDSMFGKFLGGKLQILKMTEIKRFFKKEA